MPEEISPPLESTAAAEPTEAAEDQPQKKKVSPLVWIGAAVLGLTILSFVILLVIPATWRVALRDASVILLVLLLLIFVLLNLWLIAVVIWGVDRLGKRLDLLLQQGSQVLDQVKGTATTVKGTADFVGERIASPFISLGARINGAATGVRTFIKGKQEKGEPQ